MLGFMPDFSSPNYGILWIATLVVLVVQSVVMVGIFRKLSRIERRFKPMDGGAGGLEKSNVTAAGAGRGGPFDEFLAEDPGRKNLSKSEQFAAYRAWRQAKGLNWSKADEEG